VNRPGSFSIAAAAVGLFATLCGVARAEVAAADSRFFLRVAPGAAYLHESWTPSGGAPGAVFSGGGASLEVSIGKSVRPRLVVGGLWQLVDVPDPNESYLGTTYVTPQTFRIFDVVSAFVDYTPNPRRGLHVGGSVGLLAASNLDRDCCLSTHWGRCPVDPPWLRGLLFPPMVGRRVRSAGGLPVRLHRGECLVGFERTPAHAGARAHVRLGGRTFEPRCPIR
jgi:hypothetical protein